MTTRTVQVTRLIEKMHYYIVYSLLKWMDHNKLYIIYHYYFLLMPSCKHDLQCLKYQVGFQNLNLYLPDFSESNFQQLLLSSIFARYIPLK